MSVYGFILRFLMPSGKLLPDIRKDEDVPLALSDTSGLVVIRHLAPRPNDVPSSPERYEIRGSGFGTGELASACGKQLKSALSVVGCELDCGIDVGSDRATSGAGRSVKDMFRDEFGVQLRDTIHGLDVFDEDLPVRRMESSAILTVTYKVQGFLDKLCERYKDPLHLTEKQRFALTYYNSILFEPSPQARFLNLITVLEILAHRDIVSLAAVECIGRMNTLLRGARLADSELRSLTNALHNMKRLSIGQSCRDLVRQHLGNQDADYFAQCYRVRSELFHSGRTSTPERIDPGKLGAIVKSLMLAELQST